MSQEIITIDGLRYYIVFETINGFFIKSEEGQLVYKDYLTVEFARRKNDNDKTINNKLQ